MYARVITLHVREGKAAEVVRIIREVVVPDAARQPGFLGFVLTSDRGAGKLVGNSYWGTEAEMLASESYEYLQEAIGRVVALRRGPPVVEHHEVEIIS